VDVGVEILSEIADALAHAHDRGLVHRDIKPENVLISGSHALLADLGISKAVCDTGSRHQLTTVGMVVGTPDYMAPEQATAEPDIDHRADIYAMGVVAYEMLTGRRPFQGKSTQEILAAQVIQEPPPILEHRAGIPSDLARLVMRCLEKSPAARWQSAQEILHELKLVSRGESSGRLPYSESSSHPAARLRRTAWVAAAGTALVAAGIGLFNTLANEGDLTRRRIAVLPFENLSAAEDDYFSDGVTRDINTRISKIGDFMVIAHGSARQAKASGESYREMATQLGVQFVVDGSVSRVGERVLITASLIDPETDEQIWTNDYDRELSAEHIFTIRADVAQQVARALDVALSPAQEAELSARPTDDLEAYQEYLLGLFHWERRTPEAFETSIRHFQRAIELDPGYALAYAGLADVYLIRPWFSADYSNREGLALADSMARKALDLDPGLAQPHATLGLAHEWQLQWQDADTEFRRAIDLDPEYATARHWYALLLARMGRHAEAQVQAQMSLELDPLSPIINQDVGYVLHLAGEREESLRWTERTVELHPDFSTTVLVLALRYLEGGRYEEGGEVLSRWAGLTGNDLDWVMELVELKARYDSTGVRPPTAHFDMEGRFPPYSIPGLYLLLGQPDAALDYLERGFEEGAFGIMSMVFDPALDELRPNPRFTALLERTGIPR
jgi:serine/threonine-protein kinase